MLLIFIKNQHLKTHLLQQMKCKPYTVSISIFLFAVNLYHAYRNGGHLWVSFIYRLLTLSNIKYMSWYSFEKKNKKKMRKMTLNRSRTKQKFGFLIYLSRSHKFWTKKYKNKLKNAWLNLSQWYLYIKSTHSI